MCDSSLPPHHNIPFVCLLLVANVEFFLTEEEQMSSSSLSKIRRVRVRVIPIVIYSPEFTVETTWVLLLDFVQETNKMCTLFILSYCFCLKHWVITRCTEAGASDMWLFCIRGLCLLLYSHHIGCLPRKCWFVWLVLEDSSTCSDRLLTVKNFTAVVIKQAKLSPKLDRLTGLFWDGWHHMSPLDIWLHSFILVVTLSSWGGCDIYNLCGGGTLIMSCSAPSKWCECTV